MENVNRQAVASLRTGNAPRTGWRESVLATVVALAVAVPAQATDRNVNNTGLCNDVTGTPAYCTIQAAVNAASPGDTINVAAGTYPELVKITQTLILQGAQHGIDARSRSGPETVVGMADGAFQILADNVTIDGFTAQGVTTDCSIIISALCAGIHTNNAFSGHRILNNIVQNNIFGIYLNSNGVNPSLVQFNLIQNNNVASGSSSGNGIYSDQGLSNVVIDRNKLTNNTNAAMLFVGASQSRLTISNNSADNSIALINTSNSTISGNAIIKPPASGVFIGGNDTNIALTCNTFISSATRGVRINNDAFGSLAANSNITLHNNDFFRNTIAGLEVDTGAHVGTVNATNNWWGCPAGANTPACDAAIGNATVIPFLSRPSDCAPIFGFEAPMLSQWGLLGLATLLLGVAARSMRKIAA